MLLHVFYFKVKLTFLKQGDTTHKITGYVCSDVKASSWSSNLEQSYDFFPNITCVNYRVGPCYNCLCQLDFDDLYLNS